VKRQNSLRDRGPPSGATHLVHLKTDGREFDPINTAPGNVLRVVTQLEASRGTYDLILLGNEAPDTGGLPGRHSRRPPNFADRASPASRNLEGDRERPHGRRREFRGGGRAVRTRLPCVLHREGRDQTLPRYPQPSRAHASEERQSLRSSNRSGTPVSIVKVGLRSAHLTRERAEILGTGVGGRTGVCWPCSNGLAVLS